jgi:hypothetical protein
MPTTASSLYEECLRTKATRRSKLVSRILLGDFSITEADYQSVESVKPNGEIHTRKSLRKAELCERMCQSGSEEDFAAFTRALDIIESYLDSLCASDSTAVKVEGTA